MGDFNGVAGQRWRTGLGLVIDVRIGTGPNSTTTSTSTRTTITMTTVTTTYDDWVFVYDYDGQHAEKFAPKLPSARVGEVKLKPHQKNQVA